MKTLRKKFEEIINAQITGHPSNKEKMEIRRIHTMIIELAQRIDNIERQ